MGLLLNLRLVLGGFPSQLRMYKENLVLWYKNNILGIPARDTRQNLLTYSEDFSNADWVKISGGTGSAPVLTGGQTDPNGSSTAYEVVFDLNGGSQSSASNFSLLQQSVSGLTIGNEYSGKIWLKGAIGGEELTFRVVNTHTQIILTNEWAEYDLQQIADATTKFFDIGIRGGQGFSVSDNPTVYIWGAQLNEGDTADEYVKTEDEPYSFKGDETQLNDYSGAFDKENLLTYSEDFSNADWAKINGSTITANSDIAPNGTLTADTIDAGTNVSYVRVRQIKTSIISNSTYTAVINVKKELTETNYGGIGFLFQGTTTQAQYVIVDAVNGTINTVNTITASIQQHPDSADWWQIIATATDINSNTEIEISYYGCLSTNGTALSTGDWSDRTIWGAQLNEGASAKEYVKTEATAIDVINEGNNGGQIYSGGALSFDGTNDNVDVNKNFFNGLTQFSVEFIAKGDAGTGRWICDERDGTNDGVAIGSDPSTGLYVFYANSTSLSSTAFGNGTYNKITCVADGTNLNIYSDGVLDVSTAFSEAISTTQLLKIGSSFADSAFYDGEISDFKVYNRALTASEILQNYNNPQQPITDGLEVWYDFNELNGGTLFDRSGNGYNATINGATWVSGVKEGYQPALGGFNVGTFELLDSITGDTTNLDAPYSVTVTPDGNYAVAVGLTSDSIVTYDISDKSNITLLDSIVGDSTNLNAPYSVAVTADGNYAVAVGLSSNSIVTYDISDKSNITLLDSIVGDTTNLNAPYSVTVTPDGNYAVAVGRDSDSIVTYDISDKSNITLLDSIVGDSTNLNAPHSVAVTPDGNYAVAVGRASDSIVTYDISDKSNITLLDSIVGDSTNLDLAISVTVTPDGNYAVAVGFSSDSIVTYDISDKSNITLLDSIVGDSVNLDAPISVTVTPDGNYAVAVGFSSDSIVTYDIGDKSNITLLDSIVGDTTNLDSPRSVAVTPDGNYAVAVGEVSDSIVTYDISIPWTPEKRISGTTYDADVDIFGNTIQAPYIANALNFSGGYSGLYVDAGANVDTSGAFSFAGWVYVPYTAATQFIMANRVNDAGLQIAIENVSATQFRFTFTNEDSLGSASFAVSSNLDYDNWYFLSVTRGNNDTNIFRGTKTSTPTNISVTPNANTGTPTNGHTNMYLLNRGVFDLRQNTYLIYPLMYTEDLSSANTDLAPIEQIWDATKSLIPS